MADLAVIDIAPLFTDDRKAQKATDEDIRRAVFETGGFVISNYPDADKVDVRGAKMLAFFDLPYEIKRGVATRAMDPEGRRIYRGYVASLAPGCWAHNETYDIGPEDPVAGPAIPGMEIFAETNIWPHREPRPGWRRAMHAYYDHMERVGRAVMLSVGRAVGYADAELMARFEGGNSTLRLLNYPTPPRGLKVDAEDDDPPLATRRHTDAAGLSLLWQRQPGLQAQAPDGTWRDVPRLENCISVHLGTVLELMTGGRVPATPHRVIARGTPRQSIGFFLEPALSARLAPLDGAAAPPDRAPAAGGTYGWHLQSVFHQREAYAHLVPAPEQAGAVRS